MLHVGLQRVAVGAILEDELAREVNFYFRNLVQRVDFRVVNNGRIETSINRFLQKHAVKHASRVRAQTKADVAHAENGSHLGQLALDQLYSLQGFNASIPVI